MVNGDEEQIDPTEFEVLLGVATYGGVNTEVRASVVLKWDAVECLVVGDIEVRTSRIVRDHSCLLSNMQGTPLAYF